MSTKTTPTPTQVNVIRYFNGDVTAGQRERPPSQATYRVCEREGWIEPTDEWPYHRTTRAGAEAVGMAHAAPYVPSVAE